MAGEPSLYLIYRDFTTDERNSDSELERRKFAARVLFEALDEADDELASQRGIPAKVRGRAVDVLAYARWAAYAVFFTGTWTAAQQTAWAAAMLDGPSDAADMPTFVKTCSAMTDAEVPTTTSAWVSPVDGSRSTTAGAKVASARWNSGIGDLTAFTPGNAGWIENIT